MSYASLSDNQTVSFSKLSNAVSNGIFRQKTSFSATSEMITKSDADTYVFIDTSHSSYSSKSSSQLLTKSNLKPSFDSSGNFYSPLISGTYTGWETRGLSEANYSGQSAITAYWNGTFGNGTTLFVGTNPFQINYFYVLVAGGTNYSFSLTSSLFTDSATGLRVVGVGNNVQTFTTYTEGVYDVGTNQSICSSPDTVTTYRSANSSFATGTILYTNTALTTPLTGYSRIIGENNNIWFLNTSTGAIQNDSGQGC